jgi:hypothetical protein
MKLLKSALDSKRSGKSSPAIIALVIILTIIVVVGVLWYAGYLNTSSSKTGTQTTTSVCQGSTCGSVTTTTYVVSHFNPANSNATGAGPGTINWYANRGGSYVYLGNNANGFNLVPSDNGIVYAQYVPGSEPFYAIPSDTQAKNSYVTGATYQDITGNGIKYWIFALNIQALFKPNLGSPSLSFSVYVAKFGALTMNSPSDITSIGTATTTQFIQWQGTFATVNRAWAISQIEVAFNTTSLTKMTLNSVNDPATGALVQGTSFAQQRTAPSGTGSTFYTYNVGSGQTLDQAQYLFYGSNQLNQFQFTTSVSTQFTSGDVIEVTLTVTGIDQAGHAVSASDAVLLEEA